MSLIIQFSTSEPTASIASLRNIDVGHSKSYSNYACEVFMVKYSNSGNNIILTEVYMYKIWGFQNVVFWDVTPCDSCKNGRFGGT
jgi:hypothetical protein